MTKPHASVDLNILTKKISEEEFSSIRKSMEKFFKIKDENCARYLCGDYSIKLRAARIENESKLFGVNDPDFVKMLLGIKDYIEKGSISIFIDLREYSSDQLMESSFTSENFSEILRKNVEKFKSEAKGKTESYELIFRDRDWLKIEKTVKYVPIKSFIE